MRGNGGLRGVGGGSLRVLKRKRPGGAGCGLGKHNELGGGLGGVGVLRVRGRGNGEGERVSHHLTTERIGSSGNDAERQARLRGLRQGTLHHLIVDALAVKTLTFAACLQLMEWKEPNMQRPPYNAWGTLTELVPVHGSYDVLSTREH